MVGSSDVSHGLSLSVCYQTWRSHHRSEGQRRQTGAEIGGGELFQHSFPQSLQQPCEQSPGLPVIGIATCPGCAVGGCHSPQRLTVQNLVLSDTRFCSRKQPACFLPCPLASDRSAKRNRAQLPLRSSFLEEQKEEQWRGEQL